VVVRVKSVALEVAEVVAEAEERTARLVVKACLARTCAPSIMAGLTKVIL
jgi:hypothetical protein